MDEDIIRNKEIFKLFYTFLKEKKMFGLFLKIYYDNKYVSSAIEACKNGEATLQPQRMYNDFVTTYSKYIEKENYNKYKHYTLSQKWRFTLLEKNNTFILDNKKIVDDIVTSIDVNLHNVLDENQRKAMKKKIEKFKRKYYDLYIRI